MNANTDKRTLAERKRQKIEAQLDAALEASFPASDPVAIVTSQSEEDWDAEPLPTSPPSK